jgi:hypothetical protein
MSIWQRLLTNQYWFRHEHHVYKVIFGVEISLNVLITVLVTHLLKKILI